MRIIGGRWAGRKLVSPSGRVRPTAEEVRGAWLKHLGPALEGARVVELYAGTGAVGLEALSRGAGGCDFVENNPSALHALKANVASLRARGTTRIFKRDALEFIGGIGDRRYDLALADPPYASRQLDRLIERWSVSLFATILSVEHATEHRLPGRPETLRFGDTSVSVYRATP